MKARSSKGNVRSHERRSSWRSHGRNPLAVRLATGLVAAASLLPAACSHGDRPSAGAPQPESGTLRMQLETTSDSGKVYRLRQAVLAVRPVDSDGGAGVTLRSEDDPNRAVLETFLRPGSYEITLANGWFVEQVDELLGTATPVSATLASPPMQSFGIQSDQETFVTFDFEVDGRRVGFGPPGRLIVGIGVHEREGGTPPPLNPRRSLLETNQTAVGALSLEQALAAAEQNSGFAANPVDLYQRLIDTYASAQNARISDAVHCGDETTNGAPSLNGYPIRCDRLEHQQIDNIGQWFPTAVVNRLDLAPTDGAHCGQERLVFANNAPIGNGRMFIIIEAQIPNPNPACGVAACRPLADFWARESQIDDPNLRGQRLSEAFLTGSKELLAAGFKPFLSVENLSVGSGNIRTNNFDDNEWTLREFKLDRSSSSGVRVIPFHVDSAAHGALWNDTSPFPAGAQCRQSFLDAVGGLLSNDPAEMAFVIDGPCNDAESPNDGLTQNYPFHLGQGSGAFRAALAARLVGTGLAPEDIAARAQFAGSCMGCHEEANGLSLGAGVVAPFSNGFVQVDEQFTEDCGDGTQCFAASPALKQVFLPRRLRALEDLEASSCTSPDGGVAAEAGAPPINGARPTGTRMTIGGQPAAVTH